MTVSKQIISFMIALMVCIGVFTPQAVHAETQIDLPDSSWYAIVWNRTSDTLHWLNSVGEQASIPRPQLPDEGDFGVSLVISPDGRYMVQHGALQNGRYGIGFYDLEAGEYVQIHEAQADEIIIPTERNPFTWDSQFVAFGLRSPDNWRVIAFETATGDSVGELTSDHANIPANYIPDGHLPTVALYDLDEGLGQFRVHVRFVPNAFVPDDMVLDWPGLAWMPSIDLVYTDTFASNIGTFDVLNPAGGQMLYVVRDAQNPGTTSAVYQSMMGHFDAPDTVFATTDALAFSPRWVAGGLMIAYRVAQQPFATMWHLAPAVGGEGIPFAPDYEELYGTIDGFIIVNFSDGHMKFSNTLQFPFFTPSIGNTIYEAGTDSFRVVYITPIGTDFDLASLKDASGQGSVLVAGGVDVAPPVGSSDDDDDESQDVAPLPPIVTIVPTQQLGIAAFPTSTPPPPPLQIAPVPTSTPPLQIVVPVNVGDGDCSIAVLQQVSVGMPGVRVLNIGGTLALRINLNDEFPSYQVPANTFFDIIGGPVCNGGHRMWRISVTLNGQTVTGYVSEGVNGVRYIAQAL